MRSEIENDIGLPILFETGGQGLTVVYVDAREQLGHYLEMVCTTAEGWQAMGWPGPSGNAP